MNRRDGVNETLMSAPREVTLELTRGCNLSCPFCYVRLLGNRQETGDLRASEWLLFLEELADARVFLVGFVGGEPFVYPGFGELVDKVRCLPMRFKVFSNGTLLDEAWAERLANTGRCHYVQISVDGREAEHDAVRGKGNWRKAVQALRNLKACGIPRHVNMVAARETADSVVDAARWLIEETQPQQLRIQIPLGVPEEQRLPYPTLAQVIRKTLALAKDYPNVVKGGVLDYYRKAREPGIPQKEVPSCRPQLGASCFVRHDGMLTPCDMARESVMGRINDVPFLELWRHSPIWANARDAVLVPRELPEECKGCPWAWRCQGHCLSCLSNEFCYRKLHEFL